MEKTLTEAVLDYQQLGIGIEELLRRIAVFVYRYPRTRLGWNEDDCGDFFCCFFPKLRRLVERFEYHGKPFEVYLIVTLKWQLRTYAGRKAVENLRHRVLAQENFWACDGRAEYLLESPVEPSQPEIPTAIRSLLRVNERNRIDDPPAKRRVLLLALKSAARLTEGIVGQVAHLTGYDPDWIHGLVEELRARIHARRGRIMHLSEKRNCCFFRIYCLQEQIRLVAETDLRCELTRQLCDEQSRLSNTLEEISRVPLSPTHRDIAEVLGIPKGTVDSGLYYLKDSLAALSL